MKITMKRSMKRPFYALMFVFFLIGFAAEADEIDQLVADLSNTNRAWSWNSGGYFNLGLPQTASTNDVIKRILEMNQIGGQEVNYELLAIRQVHIPNGLRADLDYTAAIVLKDGRKKIVLFNYWGPAPLGWWNRVYKCKSEALGCIDLSVKNAKLESEFIWPMHGSPGFLLEHSGLNYGLPLGLKGVEITTQPKVPFAVQIEIFDKHGGQMVMSNSVSEFEMPYEPEPMPSDTIRINDPDSVFRAGHSYFLFLQVLQETKGLGCADVYLK